MFNKKIYFKSIALLLGQTSYAHWLEKFAVFCIYQVGVQYFRVYILNNFISGFVNMNKVPGRKHETEGTSWEVTTFDGFCVLKKVFSVIQSSMELEQLSKYQYFYVITVCCVATVLSGTS